MRIANAVIQVGKNLKFNLMKSILVLFSLVFVIQAHSQIMVTYAEKPSGAYISQEELINGKELKLSDSNVRITGFTVSVSHSGYIWEERSLGSRITEAQKEMFKKCLPGEKIYFEQIEGTSSDGTRIKFPDFSLVKDGPIARLVKDPYYEEYASPNSKTDRIYAYPDHESFDTSLIKVISFKIKSYQPDFYYEYESKNNMLTAEMLEFFKRVFNDFYISDIKATDTANNIISLKPIHINTGTNIILRKKEQLIKSAKFDLISLTANFNITSFRILKPGDFEREKDSFIASDSDKFTGEMKKYLTKCNLGDIISFSVDYNDGNNTNNTMEMLVKLVE